ncbi:nucleophile aminohydrolase [Paraphoma chrysanthemicola]|uniref:Nucleophile aminohydrolase n=1 Tax=Paraphoma chrysanthemicola TaxID=798071 RepID=A0A8K0QTE9_9PLEO|nr:nucleophile aminohydrolase [Paraphoma chrysanthemicola]
MSEPPIPQATKSNGPIKPRIIIHGGAGNITKTSIPRDRYNEYHTSLLRILSQASFVLSYPGISALDVATYAVTLLENDPLYNSGHGAVFTRAGHNELEASIMVSDGYRKRGVGVMMLQHIKNPIRLARELLMRGEEDGGDGSQDHCQYSGKYAEWLAAKWGLEIVDEEYFFTQRKWDEHKRGLAEDKSKEEQGLSVNEVSEWEKETYVPLGTCGAVVVDSFGTICVATSTGGLTNKVPGRIGDTPTLGAGFWAEEWFEAAKREMLYQPSPAVNSPLDSLSRGDLRSLMGDCLPSSSLQEFSRSAAESERNTEKPSDKIRHAVGLSGSGNGDSFLRMCAARTTAANSRFSRTSLSRATTWMTGPGGELQKSAGERWGTVHEGTGGIIGVEVVGSRVDVVCDYNCGGMFRAWTEEDGSKQCLIFRKDSWDSGPEDWNRVHRNV